MAGNKKISQLVDGGSGQSGDNFVIERGGVNFKVDNASVSGNPGGLDLLGIVNDMIVKDEKSEVALEQRQVLPSPISFVDNTAAPPTEVDGDIYLLDDTGVSHVDWDGLPVNTWARRDGTAGLWKGIAPIDGLICTIQDTGDVRYFNPTTSMWEVIGAPTTPAGANTEIQFNNLGAFGADSGFTLNTAFNLFSCDFAATFNDSGLDRDFRIESLLSSNSFSLDGATGHIGFGVTPDTLNDITYSTSGGWISDYLTTDASDIEMRFTTNNLAVPFRAKIALRDSDQVFEIGTRNGFIAFTAGNVGGTQYGQMSNVGVWSFNTTLTTGRFNVGGDAAAYFNVDQLNTGSVFMRGDTDANLFVVNAGTENIGIGTSVHGTNALRVLGQTVGVAPTTSPANMAQMYVIDWNGAATATTHIRNEEGDIFIYKKSAAYTPSNVTPDRSFDADTVAIAELADVVGTLIADLQGNGLLG